LVLNYIKDCQSILEEVVSADRTKNNNKMAKLSNEIYNSNWPTCEINNSLGPNKQTNKNQFNVII
jgi:hypothetical protein